MTKTHHVKAQEDNAGKLVDEALVLHRAGDLEGAARVYTQINQQFPNHADAWGLLGLVRQSQGQLELAVSLQSRAVALNPHANYFSNRASAQLELKNYPLAASDARKAIKLDPLHGAGYINLLNALQRLGKLDEAIAQGEAAKVRLPGNADLLNNLGSCYLDAGQVEAAYAVFEAAVNASPTHTTATANLAKLAWLKPDNPRAAKLSEQAFAQGCSDVQVLYPWCKALQAESDMGLVGEALQRLLQRTDAAAHLAKALNDADFLNLVFAAANHAQRLRRFAMSHELLGLLDLVKPDHADVVNNLAVSYFAAEDYISAQKEFVRANGLAPDHAMSQRNLGVSHFMLVQPEEAMAAFAKAYALEPNNVTSLLYYFGTKLQCCDWTDYHSLREQLFNLTRTQDTPDLVASLTYLVAVETAQDMAEIAPRVGASLFWNAPKLNTPAPKAHKHAKIRVGYYSYDFRTHPVSYLTEELYTLHDRSAFEIYALSYGPNDQSVHRKAIENGVDHFVELAHLSLADSAQAIRDLELDIVVDLTGNTQGNRSQVLGARVAPIQCHWLGYVWSMGHETYDYILGDAFSIPPELEFAYTEKIARLPHTLQISSRKLQAAEVQLSREAMKLPPDAFVFANFSAFSKYQPEVFKTWLDILRAIPTAVLWLARTHRTPVQAFDRLRKFIVAQGIDPARIIFSDPLPREQYLRMYELVDVLLDTFPQGSGTTAIEALWMGCPIVSMAGRSETLSGRMTGGILNAVGLHGLVTDSLLAYKEKAIHLATHPKELISLRNTLKDKRETHPLFDTPQKVRYLEQAFKIMHEKALAGHAPLSFDVPA